MPRTKLILLCVCALAPAGCSSGWVPPVDEIQIPPELKAVLDDPQKFIAAKDDPFEAIKPGTVLDGLYTLTGCWGTVFTEADIETNVSRMAVFHFDGDKGTYTGWSAIGLKTGGLWPLMPIISTETGSFQVTSDTTLSLTMEHTYSNADQATGHLTTDLREEIPSPSGNPRTERSALITLQRDRMLFFLGVEKPKQVDPKYERPIYRRFDCPAAEPAQ